VTTTEAEFQIFECSNPSCHFRCPSNLTERRLERCPLCGADLLPQGSPFINQKRLAEPANSHIHLEVLLDNLRSTLNVGSIFRTADGAGVQFIFCCGTTPTPDHPKIAKTSLGAEDFTPWEYRPNALDLVNEKRQAGFQIISMEASESSHSLFAENSLTSKKPFLLVMGNEVSGIDPEILQISDEIFYIPMYGKKSSLNVAVAFGIAVYALFN
jgi:tRNA G18 (ribose-2'-O)-methylase SpoU